MFLRLNSQVFVKESLNWMLVVTVVAILSLLFGRILVGAMPPTETEQPGLLPPMEAIPMGPMMETPRTEKPRPNNLDVTLDLWRAMELHRGGKMEEALAAWQELQLPAESDVWRQIALTAAHLRLGQTDEAAEVLEALETAGADNPLVCYYKAIVLLTQAAEAPDLYDSVEITPIRLAAFNPEKTTPAATLYRLAAIRELEAAIRLADNVILEQPLVPPVMFVHLLNATAVGTGVDRAALTMARNARPARPYEPTPLPIDIPTVGHLLTAIAADNFAAKAHNMLGPLYLDQGLLDDAEQHMDAATEMGMNVLAGYRELAERYAAEGRHADAFRANLKDMAHGGGIVGPGRDAWRNLQKSLHE
jgi:tetratricopeptide (TPR) repeat protein